MVKKIRIYFGKYYLWIVLNVKFLKKKYKYKKIEQLLILKELFL